MKSSTKNNKKQTMEPLLHRTVQFRLAMFLQHFPPREFNRQFRNMFIDYLKHRAGISHRVNNEMIIEGTWDLLMVLDEAENYWKLRDCDEIIEQYRGKKS